jgi:hypothetical protein
MLPQQVLSAHLFVQQALVAGRQRQRSSFQTELLQFTAFVMHPCFKATDSNTTQMLFNKQGSSTNTRTAAQENSLHW